MFRAAHCSSSGALNYICSLWFIYPCSDQTLTTAGHHMGIQTRGCKYSLELRMTSSVPLETCWAFNKPWNNKFYYKATSCWYFYWILLRCTDPWISSRMRKFVKRLYSFVKCFTETCFCPSTSVSSVSFIIILVLRTHTSFLYHRHCKIQCW